MSWHHAALERLATVPEAMADMDRYVAGRMSLTQLVRRIRDHDAPQ
ncbi:antitoxin VbhA family protein [Kocuria marina]|nr:antitoxin VbhA family protein [Kocuria marina]